MSGPRADIESRLRRALCDPRYEQGVDVDNLLDGINARTEEPEPASFVHTGERPALGRIVAGAGAIAAVAATILVAITASSGHGRGAEAPQLRPAAAAPAPARDVRTFGWTPTWLPYGLDLRTDNVTGDQWGIQISGSAVGDGPAVGIQQADAGTLRTLDPWDHFATATVSVAGRTATSALVNGDRAGDRYLLFQPVPGHWLLVVARQGQHDPADEATVERIALGLVNRALVVAAATAPH